ncbi:tRNA (N6-threonylcarbamoyladenosine(37)-N6)-methyltransferase TrmO [Candidatus Dependentiae bacterium]|nr:tRNA (N6-threonylcarbamoyladenosine(37)-N6)-methyltransferase TrmO [Candidatus Dependentiae bacterium]
MKNIQFTPIGVIHSFFKKTEGVPIQASAAKGTSGTVEVFQKYAEGLKDLDGFSHIILIYYFHRVKKVSLKAKPFMDDEVRGIFSIRGPSRPNPIGISIVRLEKVVENILYIMDLDIVDETPLLDIKPYVPEFDARKDVKIGWLEKHIHKLSKTKSDNRFQKGEIVMGIDLEMIKQMSAERLCEDEGFLSELREKLGDEGGQKKFLELENIIIEKVDDFKHLNDHDKIMEEMGIFIRKLKDDILSEDIDNPNSSQKKPG